MARWTNLTQTSDHTAEAIVDVEMRVEVDGAVVEDGKLRAHEELRYNPPHPQTHRRRAWRGHRAAPRLCATSMREVEVVSTDEDLRSPSPRPDMKSTCYLARLKSRQLTHRSANLITDLVHEIDPSPATVHVLLPAVTRDVIVLSHRPLTPTTTAARSTSVGANTRRTMTIATMRIKRCKTQARTSTVAADGNMSDIDHLDHSGRPAKTAASIVGDRGRLKTLLCKSSRHTSMATVWRARRKSVGAIKTSIASALETEIDIVRRSEIASGTKSVPRDVIAPLHQTRNTDPATAVRRRRKTGSANREIRRETAGGHQLHRSRRQRVLRRRMCRSSLSKASEYMVALRRRRGTD
jgi:hypothetical protein